MLIFHASRLLILAIQFSWGKWQPIGLKFSTQIREAIFTLIQPGIYYNKLNHYTIVFILKNILLQWSSCMRREKIHIKVDFCCIIKFWHCILPWNNIWRDYTDACSLHCRKVAYNEWQIYCSEKYLLIIKLFKSVHVISF